MNYRIDAVDVVRGLLRRPSAKERPGVKEQDRRRAKEKSSVPAKEEEW